MKHGAKYLIALAPALFRSSYASYYCGNSYNDAIESCNIPCPSALGYVPQSSNNECTEDKPYCFGPDLPCTPPLQNATTGNATTGNTTEVLIFTSHGNMTVGDLNLLLDANETNTSIAEINELVASNTSTNGMNTSTAELTDVISPVNVSTNGTNISLVEMGAPVVENATVDNPENHFCGSGWQDALDKCNTSPDAIPCPPSTGGSCPVGLLCFSIGAMCTPVTPAPVPVPTLSPTSAAPTTFSPSSSPISSADESNLYFCGSTLEEANDLCGTWCRYGNDTECPQGQRCFLNTSCNATALNFTIGWDESLITMTPSEAPTTYAPTQDANPNDYYCSALWRDAAYEGECGVPCPTQAPSECPQGQYCYGPQPLCKSIYKAGVGTKWCGSTFADMASKCAKECPNGTDDECDENEICWSDSPCSLKNYTVMDLEASKGKLWCGSSYKDLVENCPKECPGGTDEECGPNMICFNMATEEVSCNTTGVGIKEPVDPANLWCGSNWNDVLENCAKPCPEGSDEECGGELVCYDLTGNDLICEYAGVGVKEKGDPNTRWCGSSYEDMLSSCPKRCPEGSNDECSGGTCFEGSPCVTEGVGVSTEEKKDTSMMFCGEDFTDAMSCSKPCSSGSSDECLSGQTCFSDVECSPDAQISMEEESDAMTSSSVSSELEDVSVTVDDSGPQSTEVPQSTVMFNEVVMEDGQSTEAPPTTVMSNEVGMDTSDATLSENLDEPASSSEQTQSVEAQSNIAPTESQSSDQEVIEPDSSNSESDSSATESSPAESSVSESSSDAKPASSSTESSSAESPEAQASTEDVPPEPSSSSETSSENSPSLSSPPESSTESAAAPVESVTSQSEPSSGNPFGEPDTTDSSSPKMGLEVKNIRMALYGLPELSSDHVQAWETATKEYFESFYNKFTDSSDTIRASVKDVVTIYLVTGLNLSAARRGLRTNRKLSDISAYLVEYTQTTRFSANEDIKLGEILQYPFNNSQKREDYVQFLQESDPSLFGNLSYVSATFLPQAFKQENTPDISNANSETSAAPGDEGNSYDPKFSSFYCHESGEPCPTGDCANSESCIFVSDSEPVPVESYVAPPSSSEEASNIITSVLASKASSLETETEPLSSSTSPTGSDLSGSITPTNQPPYTDPSLSFSNSYAAYGPTQVKGEMILTGMELVEVENIYEWQYLTALYEQDFFNVDLEQSEDYIRNSVKNVSTLFEMTEINYGEDPSKPSTIIKFKQTIKYDSSDPEIPVTAIVTQPFLTPDYRKQYIAFLKESLPESFGTLNSSSSVPEDIPEESPYSPLFNLTDTFFCSESWPVNCQNAEPCQSGDNCPDGKKCYTAPMCMDHHDLPVSQTATVTSTKATMVEKMESISTSVPTGTSKPSTNTSNTDLNVLYPVNTYFCGSSLEDASATCGIPCPSRDSSECIGEDQKCYGNTMCDGRQSFFCGKSWFDASDKCSKPCPNGDATSCADGEGCYAMTSCQNTDSFYCGVSFEDASESCALPCPSRSSLECPDGLGCFAYTTCQGTNMSYTDSVSPESVPLNNFFCGKTIEDASSLCATGGAIPCQNGNDNQCPGSLKCFETLGCSDRSTFFCGSSWLNASETCAIPCSSGSSDECGEGQYCYAHTGCEANNLFHCGLTYEDASENCTTPCQSRSSDECPGEQLCFAYVSTCASNVTPPLALPNVTSTSYGAFGDFSSLEKDMEQRKDNPEWMTSYWAAAGSSSSVVSAPLAFVTILSLLSFCLLHCN